MTGKTHRVGGMLSVLGGYLLLEKNGMLLDSVNPLLQLAVMYPFGIYGSIVSDLDHGEQSIPSRDIVSIGINKILHLTEKAHKRHPKNKALGVLDANHRSWQTHSDLFLVLMVVVSSMLLGVVAFSADQIIIRLISLGLILGVISHLILDMLTPEGIWCLITSVLGKVTKSNSIPHKVSFVPNTKFFRTGGFWETLIRRIMWVACIILFISIFFKGIY